MSKETKILIVEDEPLIASDIEECLKNGGYTSLFRATKGDEAVREARGHKPDLVLMDIQLSGDMDGISAASVIRDSLGVPVVYVTAHADQATLDRAKVTEPFGYVLKPFKELELRTAVELAVHRHKTELARSKTNPEDNIGSKKQTPAASKLDPRATEVASELGRVEPFSYFSRDELLKLCDGCWFDEYKAGDFIIFEGDLGDAGFVVTAGRVALVKSSSSGKELIVELLPPGDPFGLFTSLDKQPYAVAVRAQVDARVLWVPRSKVLFALDQFPEISRKLLTEVFKRLRGAHNLSRSLAHDLVEVRIASALLALIPRFCAVESRDGQGLYAVEMTRQELSELIGSTPETVIRVTKAMEREGLLDLSQSRWIRILDKEKLTGLAQG